MSCRMNALRVTGYSDFHSSLIDKDLIRLSRIQHWIRHVMNGIWRLMINIVNYRRNYHVVSLVTYRFTGLHVKHERYEEKSYSCMTSCNNKTSSTKTPFIVSCFHIFTHYGEKMAADTKHIVHPSPTKWTTKERFHGGIDI